MSCYITAVGQFAYSEKSRFDEAVKLLKDHGYINEDGFLTDECESPISDTPDVDAGDLSIRIPLSLHRNLGRCFEELKPGNKGRVVWTCTDGDSQGGIIVGEEEKVYDLIEWDRENNPNDEPVDEEDEEFSDILSEIESCFIDAFS